MEILDAKGKPTKSDSAAYADHLESVHSQFLTLLQEYDRFNEFVQKNYDIKTHIDHETKQIALVVEEIPLEEVEERWERIKK